MEQQTFLERFFGAKNSGEHLICITSFSPHDCTAEEGVLKKKKKKREYNYPHFKDEETEFLDSLRKITHTVNRRKKVEIQVYLTPEPKLFSLSDK